MSQEVKKRMPQAIQQDFAMFASQLGELEYQHSIYPKLKTEILEKIAGLEVEMKESVEIMQKAQAEAAAKKAAEDLANKEVAKLAAVPST